MSPAATPDAPCIPPGPPPIVVPASFENMQPDVAIEDEMLGQPQRTPPPGRPRLYSTAPLGPLQRDADYSVTLDGAEYPGPCQKRFSAGFRIHTATP